jgi:single-strand DNA-binding protein
MSRTLNKVIMIGNVGKEPEIKYTPSGVPVVSFRLATSEFWTDRDGILKEHTDWHTVVAWRGLAEVIQKLVGKGSRIYIEGKIQTRSFEDKNGIKKHITEILAENMLLLDQKKHKEHFSEYDAHHTNVSDFIGDPDEYLRDYHSQDNRLDSDKNDIPF